MNVSIVKNYIKHPPVSSLIPHSFSHSVNDPQFRLVSALNQCYKEVNPDKINTLNNCFASVVLFALKLSEVPAKLRCGLFIIFICSPQFKDMYLKGEL